MIMYTKKQVIEQNIAIRATTPEEAGIIVRAFPECFDNPRKWIGNWDKHGVKTCYCPKSVYGGASYDREAVYKTIISLSDITDISEEQPGEEQEVDWNEAFGMAHDSANNSLSNDHWALFKKYLKENYKLISKKPQ